MNDLLSEVRVDPAEEITAQPRREPGGSTPSRNTRKQKGAKTTKTRRVEVQVGLPPCVIVMLFAMPVSVIPHCCLKSRP